MKTLMTAIVILLALAVVVVLGHLAMIEVGREVVTIRTPLPDGEWQETRLWVVDYQGVPWLHSAGESWVARFEGDPVVELERGGETRRYKAHAVPGPHPEIDAALREKYGIADRWVRFLAPCNESVVPVRLQPLADA
jgi:hypothetical protein